MNRLEYAPHGNDCWQVAMPTFRVDGVDLVELLDLTWLAENKVAGVGVSVTHPFIYPEASVFNRVAEQASARQIVLWVHLGDTVGAFVAVSVHLDNDLVHWSDFESLEGVQTTLATCGPFVFEREPYAQIMRDAAREGYRSLKDLQMYADLNESSFDTLW